jgi:hypothetical protein
MNEHSLDNLIEKIYNSKSKEYFHEVIQTYYTNCYRSSLVMLYTVVICDLIYKLEELRDVYNDSSAKKILTEIEAIQKANPKSPDWENKIVELISQRTKLLEISDVENINQVQKHRHLSAHPVLNQTSLLFKPNKETVKAHIKNMLEGVLTKPPILSTKIFNELIDDLAANKDRFTNDEELKRFLNAKYFKNLRQETLNDIYKKLWKFVFKIENDECNENRDINIKCLEVIFNQNQKEILQLLKNEESYFNGVLKGICMEYLIKHTFKYPTIFKSLSEISRSEIEYEIKQSIDFKFISWFIYDSVEEFHSSFMEVLKKGSSFYVNREYFEMLKSLYKEFDLRKEYLNLCITIFVKSSSFDGADSNFHSKIEPYLKEFTETQFEDLIIGIDSNFQVYSRNQARYNNKKIKEFSDKVLPKDFDYSKYLDFKI